MNIIEDELDYQMAIKRLEKSDKDNYVTMDEFNEMLDKTEVDYANYEGIEFE